MVRVRLPRLVTQDTPNVAKQHKRKAIVFVSLVGVLTFTSALLLVLAPAPLGGPGSNVTLLNSQSAAGADMQAVFSTQRPITSGRWTSILIRHSRTSGSQTLGNGDHFIISNGNGGVEGQIAMGGRWLNQVPAMAPDGASSIDDGCITICLVGDFDIAVPRYVQVRQLSELVKTLQAGLGIPTNRVWTLDEPRSSASVGRLFPVAEFRDSLMR